MGHQRQLEPEQALAGSSRSVLFLPRRRWKKQGPTWRKGANLCDMTQIGLNVPSGFVITTEACLHSSGPAKRPA